MRKVLSLAVAVLSATAVSLSIAVPAAHAAGTVTIAVLNNGDLHITDSPGNSVRINALIYGTGLVQSNTPIVAPACVSTRGTASLPFAVTCRTAVDEIFVVAGDGDDTVSAFAPGPVGVVGGAGNDTISATSYLSQAFVWSDQLVSDNNQTNAGDGHDTVTVSGSVAANVVTSGGNDKVTGGATKDFIVGGSGSDTIDGGAGPDVIDGGTENDTLRGQDGADTLTGAAGADIIRGGNAKDVINAIDGTRDEIYCGQADGVKDTVNADAIDFKQYCG